MFLGVHNTEILRIIGGGVSFNLGWRDGGTMDVMGKLGYTHNLTSISGLSRYNIKPQTDSRTNTHIQEK